MTRSERDQERDKLAGTLERGLGILQILTRDGPVAAGHIMATLDLSRSATYRILGVLRQWGYVEWDPRSERIELGPQAVILGMSGLTSFDPFGAAQAHLRDLSGSLAETALMAVRDGNEMVYIAHEDVSGNMIGVRRLLGVRRPIYATSLGKAFLAAMPISESDRIVDDLDLVAFTPTTITEPARLRAELDETRTRGYAVDNGEHEPDVLCYGAAICDDRGQPICAISVAGPRERMLDKADVPTRVAEAARSVSQRLGHFTTPPLRR